MKELQQLASVLLNPLTEDAPAFLKKVSDPPFLSVFGAALGLDWRHSGHTHHVLELVKNTGDNVFVVGGKTRKSIKAELDRTKSPMKDHILNVLRMTEKVDTCALQEGPGHLSFQYILADDNGHWVVISQKLIRNEARRYHWASERKNFVEAPHAGILGEKQATVLDLTAPKSAAARKVITDLAQERVTRLNKQIMSLKAGQRSFFNTHFPTMPLLKRFFPEHLCAVREAKPKNFEELLALSGIGPATIRALAALAMQFYGVSPSLTDPATHGWDGMVYTGTASAAQYAQLFLDIAEHEWLHKRQRFELTERLSPFLKKHL